MGYCNWGLQGDDLMRRYHDEEWGIPVHDDQKQFEHLMMEVMQCGLSWAIVLKKREILRACFDNFDYEKIAAYDETDVERILATEGMIRARRKIAAIINNAQRFMEIRAEYGSFCDYIWRYTDGKTLLYTHHEDGVIPASNGLSERIAKDLKARGFKFLGPVTIYSHLQSSGIINDHSADCPCYAAINSQYPTRQARRTGEKNVVDYRKV